MRVLAVIALVISAVELHAQDSYVLTLKGDTLRGPLKILSYDALDRVSINTDGKKVNLTAVQVRYLFFEETTYAPVQHEKTIRFMRVIRPGYLTLYGYRQPYQTNYDSRLLVKMNGEQLDLPNIGFKKILSEFLADCETTAAKVKAGDFERSNVEAIVDDYNVCVAGQNKVVISTTKPTPLIEAVAALRTKVDSSSIESKKDVLDLLNDIDGKAKNKQSIPPYLASGLKSYLADKKEFEAELNNLLALLN
jgi:hypothetical protein